MLGCGWESAVSRETTWGFLRDDAITQPHRSQTPLAGHWPQKTDVTDATCKCQRLTSGERTRSLLLCLRFLTDSASATVSLVHIYFFQAPFDCLTVPDFCGCRQVISFSIHIVFVTFALSESVSFDFMTTVIQIWNPTTFWGLRSLFPQIFFSFTGGLGGGGDIDLETVEWHDLEYTFYLFIYWKRI